ncbi:imidazole glycerol phosphate synthase subunit HisH [Sulfitobacter sp. 1A12057]|uniref:imidazole glycerol phosphate synthase subunit HisH n=1 Tax=Sulfitobacter sp. 1A12057 TaxID=3368567 RepID=UPI003746D506
MIGIIDYGLGNVRAFENIYRRLNIDVRLVRSAEELEEADRLILPGVGAFDWAMTRLKQSGMNKALNRRVLSDRVPVLGVCVGMQMMATRSDEGNMTGLGWVPGRVKRFDETKFSQRTHLPHMGWNSVEVNREPLFEGIDDPQFYFLHSYFFDPDDATHAVAHSDYGTQFASAIRRDNVRATQFHPEKSHHWGTRLLKNFAENT